MKLSQCLIVKDEEKNIERALTWGRDIMYEQIVVDTGSTDRTVEMAESLGAKVFLFEWINDFSAAKNYAIEQAGGEWIAFLDADEYIEPAEAAYIPVILEFIASDPDADVCMGIACQMADLDEMGRIKEVYDNRIRIFRNHPSVRYQGRIHEDLTIGMGNAIKSKKFQIKHTGYTSEAHRRTNKAARNIELLRAQLRVNPQDADAKSYLADALLGDIMASDSPEGNEAKTEEVDAIYNELIPIRDQLMQERRKVMYRNVLSKYAYDPEIDPKLDALCFEALEEFPEDTTFLSLVAMTYNKKGDFQAAFELLKKCEAQMEDFEREGLPLTTNMLRVFPAQMIIAAQGLGDIDTTLKYAEILLLSQKTNMDALRPFISTLMKKGLDADAAIEVLSRVYDFSDKSELLLIARAAMECGAIELAQGIVRIGQALGVRN